MNTFIADLKTQLENIQAKHKWFYPIIIISSILTITAFTAVLWLMYFILTNV